MQIGHGSFAQLGCGGQLEECGGVGALSRTGEQLLFVGLLILITVSSCKSFEGAMTLGALGQCALCVPPTLNKPKPDHVEVAD